MRINQKLYNTYDERLEAEVIGKDEKTVTLFVKDNSTGEVATVVFKKWEMKYYWSSKREDAGVNDKAE